MASLSSQSLQISSLLLQIPKLLTSAPQSLPKLSHHSLRHLTRNNHPRLYTTAPTSANGPPPRTYPAPKPSQQPPRRPPLPPSQRQQQPTTSPPSPSSPSSSPPAPNPRSLYPPPTAPRPDPITRAIDQITSIPRPTSLSKRILRIWRLSEVLSSITTQRLGHMPTVRKESTAAQKESLRLVMERLGMDERIGSSSGEKDGKGGGGDGGRWGEVKRKEFRRVVRELGVFDWVMNFQFLVMVGGGFGLVYWMVRRNMRVRDVDEYGREIED